MNERLPVLVGGFLSGLCIVLGTIGILVFSWRLSPWFLVDGWPKTTATIVEAREESSSGRGGVRSFRPWFVYHYSVDGADHRGEGFDVIGHFRGDLQVVREIVDAHPVGSQISVFINPEDPTESYVARGSADGLFILLVPPFFLVLGLTGAWLTIAGAMGKFSPGSVDPVARGQRAAAAWLFRESTIRVIVFGAFGGVISLLLVFGVLRHDPVLIGIAALLAYGLWVATKVPHSRRNRR